MTDAEAIRRQMERDEARYIAKSLYGPAEDATHGEILKAVQSVERRLTYLESILVPIGATVQQRAALERLGLPVDVSEREAGLMLRSVGAKEKPKLKVAKA